MPPVVLFYDGSSFWLADGLRRARAWALIPVFQISEGRFWGAYPARGRAGLLFEEMACPQSFIDRPELAWGFTPKSHVASDLCWRRSQKKPPILETSVLILRYQKKSCLNLFF